MGDYNNTNEIKPATKVAPKKRDFQKRHPPYKKSLDNKFFELAEQGMSLTSIAYTLGIPKPVLLRWSEDELKRSFVKAYAASKEACQAYHERLFDDMILGRIPKLSAKQIDAQSTRLKVFFKEDWAPIEKKELEVTNKAEQMSDEDLNNSIEMILNNEGTRQYLKEIVENNFKPNLKEVSKDEQ